MSGLEIVGLAASVMQIAELGGKLSVRLFTLTRKVKAAHKSIDALSQDIAVTGAVLQQLGEALSKDKQLRRCSPEAIRTARTLVDDTKKVFNNLENLIDGDDNAGKRGSKNISLKTRLKFPFLESEIEQVQANLERLKSSLLVILNVLIFAEQLRNQEALPILDEQRELIKVLAREKTQNEERHETLLKAIKDRAGYDDPGIINSQTSGAMPIKGLATGSSNTSSSTLVNPGPFITNMTSIDGPGGSIFQSHSALGLPAGLQRYRERLQQHSELTQKLLSEIASQNYKIDQNIRGRMHDGVLDIHYQHWHPHRQKYDYRLFEQMLSEYNDVVTYWTDKHYEELDAADKHGSQHEDISMPPMAKQEIRVETLDDKTDATVGARHDDINENQTTSSTPLPLPVLANGKPQQRHLCTLDTNLDDTSDILIKPSTDRHAGQDEENAEPKWDAPDSWYVKPRDTDDGTSPTDTGLFESNEKFEATINQIDEAAAARQQKAASLQQNSEAFKLHSDPAIETAHDHELNEYHAPVLAPILRPRLAVSSYSATPGPEVGAKTSLFYGYGEEENDTAAKREAFKDDSSFDDVDRLLLQFTDLNEAELLSLKQKQDTRMTCD